VARKKIQASKEPTKIKLDIACGQNKQEGFTGIDIAGDADITHDLFKFPWPIEDNSVSEVFCSHFVEHIPHYRPDWGEKDGWWLFWEEVYRVCEPGAKIVVLHPYVKSDRAFWDPTHIRFIHEMTWYYLDAEWRKVQKLDHYQTTVDFECVVIAGNGIAEDMATRSAEAQAFGRQHYWNVVADLQIELKVRK
jgi:hypothetical protein